MTPSSSKVKVDSMKARILFGIIWLLFLLKAVTSAESDSDESNESDSDGNSDARNSDNDVGGNGGIDSRNSTGE